MSRSNPDQVNPAKRFLQWSGDKGVLHYYDKEKQERVEVKLPFSFLPLDQLATITGFCEQDQSSYWSNEVRSIAKDELTVKTSAGTKQTGLYKDLADVRSKGAKYAKSVYMAFYDGSELVIGNFKASGAALTAWIELSSRYVVENGKVTLTGSEEGKKGAITYHIPTFEYASATDEENQKAIELDKELQIYLSQYLAANKEPRSYEQEFEEITATQVEENIKKAAASEPKPTTSWEQARAKLHAKKSEEDDPELDSLLKAGLEADDIDLSEIPF